MAGDPKDPSLITHYDPQNDLIAQVIEFENYLVEPVVKDSKRQLISTKKPF